MLTILATLCGVLAVTVTVLGYELHRARRASHRYLAAVRHHRRHATW